MNFSNICRTCLSDSMLNPIFLNPKDHVRYSTAVYIAIGIKVHPHDGLPQKMCKPCVEHLNNCLRFRKKCKEVEKQLLQQKKLNPTPPTTRAKKKPRKTACSIKNPEVENDKTEYEIREHNGIKYMPQGMGKRIISMPVTGDIEQIVPKVEHEEPKSPKKETYNTENVEEGKGSKHNLPTREEDEQRIEYTDYDWLEEEEDEAKDQPQNTSKSENEDDDDESEDQSIYVYTDDEKEEVDVKQELLDPDKLPYFRLHKDKQNVTCNFCQRELPLNTIGHHLITAHPEHDGTKVKCDVCNQYFTKSRLNQHRKQIHGIAKIVLRCGYCKAEFDNRQVLIRHVPTCTAKIGGKKIPLCKVPGSSSKQVECDICQKVVKVSGYSLHRGKHDVSLVVCEHCGKHFKSKRRLIAHKRSKHGYEKLKCSLCDLEFASDVSLRNHERRHRGEKPYVCDTCGAKFHASYLLTQHKQFHRPVRMFKCEECPAIFKCRNNLHCHRKDKHSKWLHKCFLCYRYSRSRYAAVKHLRGVHDFKGSVPPLEKKLKIIGVDA